MDREVLMYQMTERFQELYSQALDALERASEGQWIAASEFAFRDAFIDLMRDRYHASDQARIDTHPPAHAASYSPSGPRRVRRTRAAKQGPASR